MRKLEDLTPAERDDLQELKRRELEALKDARFTKPQRDRLRARGLNAEQVERLEALLPALKTPRRRARTQDVRERLDDLAKAAQALHRRYVRLCTSVEPASDQVRTRLQFAQEQLGYTDWGTLERCIDAAARITAEARGAVSSDTRRSIYRNPIGQILAALAPARFEVTRKKQPFLSIVQIVSEASGGWRVDDAIRAFLKPQRGD